MIGNTPGRRHSPVDAVVRMCRSAIGRFGMLTRTSPTSGTVHDPHAATQSFLHAALFIALAAPTALPARAEDGSFDHQDWQLVCDNTRTCRVAGYQRDDADMPVSVLLTRKAGTGTAVVGRVTFGDG